MVCMQMGEKHLRRVGDRQAQPVEVRQRAGPEIEEEQVTLPIADLDQHRRRRLPLLHERITAAEDGDPDLTGGHRFGPPPTRSAYCRAGVPTTGVIVNGWVLPSHTNSVISLITVVTRHTYARRHWTDRAESLNFRPMSCELSGPTAVITERLERPRLLRARPRPAAEAGATIDRC